MNKPELTKNRIILAFTIAVIADVCEFPITYLEHFGWDWMRMIGQFGDVILDCAVMAAMTVILGYHWVFLPGFFVSVIPDIDLFPSWVAAVGYVIWERKKQQQNQSILPPQLRSALDALKENVLKALSPSGQAPSAPAQPTASTIDVQTQVFTPTESSIERRLRNLQELRDKDLISQAEYADKREQILTEA